MKHLFTFLLVASITGCGNDVDSSRIKHPEYTYHLTEAAGGFTCDTGVVTASSFEGYCNNLKSDAVNTDKTTGTVCAVGKRLEKFKTDCACWLRRIYPDFSHPKDLPLDELCQ